MANTKSLKAYQSKRNFVITSEPKEGGISNENALSFVVQKHWASHLHYDFRLELNGTMKSWAVPKGPSLDPHDKRMAVHVEDHPISYNTFEGTIPAKQYGAGKVIVWDKGVWQPIGDGGAKKGYAAGNLKFELFGHKLKGKWALIKMRNPRNMSGKQEAWLLIKEQDYEARSNTEFNIVEELPDSVKALPIKNTKKHSSSPSNSFTSPTSPAHSGPPPSALKASIPVNLKPELATLVAASPSDASNWIFEIKFDGYRMLSKVASKKVQFFTRNENDWTSKLPDLKKEILSMNLPDGWYDGEIVVMNDEGRPDFGALQQSFDEKNTQDISYFLFDIPYCSGYDLRSVPLVERREVLERILKRCPSKLVQLSAAFNNAPDEIFGAACRMGLEGIIGKRLDSLYVSRRSDDWIKLKCTQRQEFVIGGFTSPQGSRIGLGSLLLGVHNDKGQLVYAGNVGTGFNDKVLKELRNKLDTLTSEKSPFIEKTAIDKQAHWVKPSLLAEVSFGEWTRAGHIRHSVFHGLRFDKPASAIVRELPSHAKENAATSQIKRTTKTSSTSSSANQPKASILSTKINVTHPDRVIDKISGITKLQLVQYYELVTPLIMEHLKNRPVSLVRAPQGIGGELFFQKHAETKTLPGINQLDPSLLPKHPPLLVVAKDEGLLNAAQWNTVELHTMNAVASTFKTPDRIVFDLDPGEGVSWQKIQEASTLVRAFLNQLGLQVFLKTSGGKGLHLVVPIQKRFDWDTVKDFSEAIVVHLAETIPERFVAKSGPRNRVGKIFIDYLRNGLGATTVAAWSARARPGMGISVPITWEELDQVKSSNHWTVQNVEARLATGNQPWSGYAQSAKSLTSAMKKLGFKPNTQQRIQHA